MITTTSNSKPYIHLRKNLILVVTASQLVGLENKQSLALREIEKHAYLHCTQIHASLFFYKQRYFSSEARCCLIF